MSRSGGTTSQAEASPISTRGGGSSLGGTAWGGQHDRDLERALDRLSLSLERIERLLGELRGAGHSVSGGLLTPASHALPDASEPEDALVIRGDGPSAFVRR